VFLFSSHNYGALVLVCPELMGIPSAIFCCQKRAIVSASLYFEV
jgi:hypothetical protein